MPLNSQSSSITLVLWRDFSLTLVVTHFTVGWMPVRNWPFFALPMPQSSCKSYKIILFPNFLKTANFHQNANITCHFPKSNLSTKLFSTCPVFYFLLYKIVCCCLLILPYANFSCWLARTRVNTPVFFMLTCQNAC